MISKQALKEAMDQRNICRRPKISATWPKNSKKHPATSDCAALIQVTSAEVMFKASPIREVIQMTAPVKTEVCPIAIAVVNTKRNSCIVDLKQTGRLPHEFVLTECKETLGNAIGVSFSGAVAATAGGWTS